MIAWKWLAAAAWGVSAWCLVAAWRPPAPWGGVAPPWRGREGRSPWPALQALARRLGAPVYQLLPRRWRRWVEREAARAGHPLGADGWLGLSLLAGGAGALLCLPAPGAGEASLGEVGRAMVRLLAGCGLGTSTVLAFLHRRATERAVRIVRDLPALADLILLGLAGGLSLTMAWTEASQRQTGPLAVECAEADRRMRLGVPPEEAWQAMADRLELSELNLLVSTLQRAESLGGSIIKAVEALARRLRADRVLAAERRAGEAPVKMLFPLVFCLFPSVLVLLGGPLLVGRSQLLPW